MSVADRIVLVLERRHGRERLAARARRRERAAVQRVVEQQAHVLREQPREVLTEGDLICFKVSIRPC
jgi:recombinational DNA repair protein (RecF pathway)